MASRRPYRKPKSREVSVAEIQGMKAKSYAWRARVLREFKANGIAKRVDSGGLTYVLTRSAKVPGSYQVTWFTREMEPGGDTIRETLKAAIEAMHWDAASKWPKRLPMAKGLRTPAKASTIRFGRYVK